MKELVKTYAAGGPRARDVIVTNDPYRVCHMSWTSNAMRLHNHWRAARRFVATSPPHRLRRGGARRRRHPRIYISRRLRLPM